MKKEKEKGRKERKKNENKSIDFFVLNESAKRQFFF